MKRLLLFLPLGILLSECNTPKAVQTNATTASQRSEGSDNIYRLDNAKPDTITVGAQYIPLYGRNEAGVLPQLQGTWILQTMNGLKIAENAHLDTAFLNKKIPAGTEISRDSATSAQTINGVTYTTTTVQVDRMGNPIRRITPPQGSNYHIPNQPSISFYGSNDTFSGFTGCNKFSGRYSTVSPGSINLKNATSSTKMACIGDYDEEAFLNTLHQVTSFKAINGQLQFMQADSVILVFSKK